MTEFPHISSAAVMKLLPFTRTILYEITFTGYGPKQTATGRLNAGHDMRVQLSKVYRTSAPYIHQARPLLAVGQQATVCLQTHDTLDGFNFLHTGLQIKNKYLSYVFVDTVLRKCVITKAHLTAVNLRVPQAYVQKVS
jgi:hypothetical protein